MLYFLFRPCLAGTSDTHDFVMNTVSRGLTVDALGPCSGAVVTCNNNNYIFYIAPQQEVYELLALYRSTNVIKHINMLFKLA